MGSRKSVSIGGLRIGGGVPVRVESMLKTRLTDIEGCAAETEALAAIPQEGNTVVATGGGLPCSERNLSLMRQRGRIVYLASSQERLVHILLACRRDRRPRIAGLDEAGIREYVRTTLAQRESYYAQADRTVICDGMDSRHIADEIIAYVRALEELR